MKMMEKMVADEDTGCWVWVGGAGRRGYGITSDDSGKTVRATRAMWRMERGEIPPGMSVLHRCDRPACINPDHLFLGTHRDNMRDMVAKSRQAVGEHNGGGQKLTADDVREIRRRRAAGESTGVLARQFGVYDTMISAIALRQAWRHVA